MTAFHTVSGTNDAAFVFADHASNRVPDWVGELGVSREDMQRHIAWDIGSEAVARGLCERLGCAGHVCGFSRLVIDANRHPAAPGLIPATSDGTDIPANRALTPDAKDARTVRLYSAYHERLRTELEARPGTLALSIHSFTPQLRGQPKRKTDVGLLVKEDEETADRFVAEMSRVAPELRVEINQPYSAYDLNFTVDHNVVPLGLRHLAIELRQDHIASETGAMRMADRLAAAIRPLL
jgi:predicted N-formylglutamate amidohydrolase